MLLAMKVDKIFLHEKEEKRAKTESRLGVSDRRLCLLLVSHARAASKQQPSSLAPNLR